MAADRTASGIIPESGTSSRFPFPAHGLGCY